MRLWQAIVLFILSALVGFLLLASPALAQGQAAIVQQQVSNPTSAGVMEIYGVGSLLKSNQAEAGSIGELSRHRRFGEATGIGSSTFQTTSATSESMNRRPASGINQTTLVQPDFLARRNYSAQSPARVNASFTDLSSTVRFPTLSPSISSMSSYRALNLEPSFVENGKRSGAWIRNQIDYSVPLNQGAPSTSIGAKFGF